MIRFLLIFVAGLILLAQIPAKYVPGFLSGLHMESQIVTKPIVDSIKNITKNKLTEEEK